MRLIALSILDIPGILSMVGIKLIRDVMFQELLQPFPFLWMQFLAGAGLLVFGIWFIAGFIRYRDKKNRKVVIQVPEQSNEPPSNKG